MVERGQLTPRQLKRIKVKRFLDRYYDWSIGAVAAFICIDNLVERNFPAAIGWALAGLFSISSRRLANDAFQQGWRNGAITIVAFYVQENPQHDELSVILYNPPTYRQFKDEIILRIVELDQGKAPEHGD